MKLIKSLFNKKIYCQNFKYVHSLSSMIIVISHLSMDIGFVKIEPHAFTGVVSLITPPDLLRKSKRWGIRLHVSV